MGLCFSLLIPDSFNSSNKRNPIAADDISEWTMVDTRKTNYMDTKEDIFRAPALLEWKNLVISKCAFQKLDL